MRNLLKTGKICITMFLFTVLFIIIGGKEAYAGNANIRFLTDNPAIDVGGTVNISIDIEADVELADVEASISYDQNILQFVSGGDFITGADGYLRLTDKASVGGTTRHYSLAFNVIGAGESEVTLVGAASVLDVNYEEVNYAFAPVKVTGQSVVVLSDDATLKAIKISPGKLEEEFSPTLTEYKVTIPYENEYVVVNAVPNEENARVEINGVEGLNAGWNTAEIVVTAQAGNTNTYNLLIYRQFEDEAEDNKKKTESKELLENRGKMIVVEEAGRVYLSNAFTYEIVELEDKSIIPVGYKATKVTISGVNIDAYVLESNPKDNFILVYAANISTGDTDFYQYDKKENTIQRYNRATKIVSNAVTGSDLSKNEYEKKITLCSIIIALLALLLAVTMILAIKLLLKLQDKKYNEDEFEEDDEDDIDLDEEFNDDDIRDIETLDEDDDDDDILL